MEPEEPEVNITHMDASLYETAAKGNIESLLLQTNAKGQTPLHVAARYGHSAIRWRFREAGNGSSKCSQRDAEDYGSGIRHGFTCSSTVWRC
ncbi:hypothetical protein Gotur_032803 [Gossypium turneri]